MASYRDIYYSPLCDTDREAYFAFLFRTHCDGDLPSNVDKGFVVDGDVSDGNMDTYRALLARFTNAHKRIAGFSEAADSVTFGSKGLYVDSCAYKSVVSTAIGNSLELADGGSVGVRGVDVGKFDNADLGATSFGVKASVGDDRQDGVVSEKTLANREKRAKKKERKLRKQEQEVFVPEWRRKSATNGYRGAFSSCSEEVRSKLADTRAQRLIAENEAYIRKAKVDVDGWDQSVRAKRKRDNLRALQVDQKIELTRSRDLEKIKKRDEVRVLRETETSKVAVEKAYGTLAVTGNVPSFSGGSVETVLSSGSISPRSSVSEAEVRKLQKDLADSEAEQLKVRKSNDALVSRIKEMQSCALKGDIEGVKAISKTDCQAMYEESVGVSLDEEGIPYGMLDEGGAGYFDSRGRFHFGDDGGAYHDYY